MIKLKPRCIATIFAVLVLAVGSYIGWQIHLGQQIAKQYTLDAQKLAQSTSQVSPSSNPLATNSNEVKLGDSSNQASPTQASSSIIPPSPAPTNPNPNPPSSPVGTPPAVTYKQLMSNTYQQTLQAMNNVKGITIALQGRKITLAAYKASILQTQATFNSAEAYVLANPPTDTTLNAPYQKFLAGITLAKESMSVVLNGISSLSPSSLYAAREMGGSAQKQVLDGYADF